MNKYMRFTIIAVIAICALFFGYRLLFIRTVNYEIAGLVIPSTYNILTGKAHPISGYKGQPIKRTVKDISSKNIGLSDDQALLAKMRWAVFEKWAGAHPQYKGWEDNPDLFKEAHNEFRKEIESQGPRIRVIK